MEPERPIEKILRATGKHRREQNGEPFVLHAATRRLLQGEVVRKYAGRGEEAESSTVGVVPWWRSFGWSFGVFAGVILAGLLMWPREGHYEMAQANRSLVPTEEAKLGARAPEPVPARKIDAAGATAKLQEKELLGERPAAAATSTFGGAETASNHEDLVWGLKNEQAAKDTASGTFSATLGTSTNSILTLNDEFALKKSKGAPSNSESGAYGLRQPSDHTDVRTANSPVPSAGPAIAAGKSEAFAYNQNAPAPGGPFFDEPLTQDVRDRQDSTRFSRLQSAVSGTAAATVATRELQPQHAVLSLFTIEQSGDVMKVVDADGSVYTGQVEMVFATTEGAIGGSFDKKTAGEARRLANRPSSLDFQQKLPQHLYFAVHGTNRTLKQPVAFTGQFFSQKPVDLLATNILAFSNAIETSAQTNTMRLSGEATLGRRSFKVDAVPAGARPNSPEK